MDNVVWKYDTCDEHELVFARHQWCPYCRVSMLEATLKLLIAEWDCLPDGIPSSKLNLIKRAKEVCNTGEEIHGQA